MEVVTGSAEGLAGELGHCCRQRCSEGMGFLMRQGHLGEETPEINDSRVQAGHPAVSA